MNKTKLSLILAVAAAASSASAAIVNVSSGIIPATFNPADPTPILPGGAGTLANSPAINLPVDSFNGSLGTLNSVTYTLTYYSYATYELVNTGTSAATFEVQWRVGRDLDGDRNTLQIPGNGTQFSFSALGTRFVNVPPSPPRPARPRTSRTPPALAPRSATPLPSSATASRT